MKRKLRVGIIGLGMGVYHLDQYLELDSVEVAALADLDGNRLDTALKRVPDARVYRDYHKMLADDLDIVSVATPNCLHARMTLDALRAGVHVLVEKPMATRVSDARKMVAAARRCKRKLMIHHNHRFGDFTWHLHRLVKSGALGEIYFIRAQWLRRYGIPGLGGWFTKKRQAGGGALFDIGVHSLDLALWYLGWPRIQTVSGASYAVFGPALARKQKTTFDVDDMTVAMLRVAGGATIQLETAWAVNLPADELHIEVAGTRGGASIRPWHQLTLYTEDGAGGRTESVLTQCPQKPGNAISHFVNAVRDDTEPLVTAESGVQVLQALEAIQKSAATGREVRIPSPK